MGVSGLRRTERVWESIIEPVSEPQIMLKSKAQAD